MSTNKPKGRNDGHIMDYSKITDKIYIGSDLCKGADCPVHTKEFKKLKIGAEVNLNKERKEIPPDGILSYIWIPVADGDTPSQGQFEMGTSAINEAVKKGHNVYVHCKNGHGRSPAMVAAYLTRFKKKTPKEAEKIIKEKRPEIHIEKIQMAGLIKYSKIYKKNG